MGLVKRDNNYMRYLDDIKPEKKAGVFNSLVSALDKETSKGLTDNGAVTFTSSGSALVDFFAQAGAMRNNTDRALDLFKKAFAQDRQTALRILFYFRDIRGGQGERALFRTCLQWLGDTYQEVFENIVAHVPEYGRWDDMFFENSVVFRTIKDQLQKDVSAEKPSILAKWLPTINASSRTTKAKAKFMASKLGMHPIEYRKTVRAIRKKIATVEEKMSGNKWGEINYSHVPSQASRIYRKAFLNHDEGRYKGFVDAAEKGEERIQSGTLYPYQIYDSVYNDYSKTLDALWNQLPDYTQGKNAIVVADVSGSMMGRPMSVSVSLALYFAERNKGQFNGYFMTFSERPKLQKVNGKTLLDRMHSLHRAEWGMNTDLQAVFYTILSTAKDNSIPKEDMPSTIYIISDMEFDSACSNLTNFESIKHQYSMSGYDMPHLVFWNVSSRNANVAGRSSDEGVSLVSGFSPSIFKMAVENKTPEELMLSIANSKRYSRIVV